MSGVGAGGPLQKARGWRRRKSSAASGASSRSGARASDSKSRSSCYYKTGNVAEGPRPNDSRAIGARTRSCTKNRTKTYWCGRRVCACRRKSRGTDTHPRLRALHDFTRPPSLEKNPYSGDIRRTHPQNARTGAPPKWSGQLLVQKSNTRSVDNAPSRSSGSLFSPVMISDRYSPKCASLRKGAERGFSEV